jgi:hypothetical protein
LLLTIAGNALFMASCRARYDGEEHLFFYEAPA